MHIRGDHAELAVGGRLDVRSAADARTVLHAAVDAGDGDLVLDLAGLDSWDATGLGLIMGVHRRAGRCGRRLVLREVPLQLRRQLLATGLHRILAIEESGGAERHGNHGGPGGRSGHGANCAAPRGSQRAGHLHGAHILTKP